MECQLTGNLLCRRAAAPSDADMSATELLTLLFPWVARFPSEWGPAERHASYGSRAKAFSGADTLAKAKEFPLPMRTETGDAFGYWRVSVSHGCKHHRAVPHSQNLDRVWPATFDRIETLLHP